MECPYAPEGWVLQCPCDEFDDCPKMIREYIDDDDDEKQTPTTKGE
jgi:hypothetical protein